MIKYFILAFALTAVLVVGIFGVRGQKFSRPPLELFPDMDRQDKLLSQAPDRFFANGMGSRRPVDGSLPHATADGVFPLEFSTGMDGYYYTGAIDDYFGNGLPLEDLGLDAGSMPAFLRRGAERYDVSCTPCHGSSGNGKGITSYYGLAAIANLHDPRFGRDQYPDGRMYHVIANGQGLMSGYGATLPVRDRWAIVAYVRAMQAAKAAADSAGEPEPSASN
ncbi:MAG: cytochrome c [Akkermansiaceae bacterium]|nr:cytochrome c [Akkermansiaceae bacterium]NNM30653.1 cytochrome c [Akkermansiaceae bacterium]